MAIPLKPELEEIVREDVQRGPYASVEEYLEQAVTMLHRQEVWLAAHRDEIGGQNRRGMGVGTTRRSFHTGAGAGGNAREEASLD
jgi:Arc/MetJ-type ribon-helix-helix transcriptional regulator